MEKKFKVGDWVFCEYKLQQIEKMEEGRITSVTDGMFTHSGYDLTDRCFPLDMLVKRVSDITQYWRTEIGKTKGLNMPDINRALIERWVTACENIGDTDNYTEACKAIDRFGRSVIEATSNVNIEGVNLFR